MNLPNPNIHAAIKPSAKGDEEKLAVGLSTLHEEDPTFVYRVDNEVKQTIISGQGELHLTVTTERLKRRFGIEYCFRRGKSAIQRNNYRKWFSKIQT